MATTCSLKFSEKENFCIVVLFFMIRSQMVDEIEGKADRNDDGGRTSRSWFCLNSLSQLLFSSDATSR